MAKFERSSEFHYALAGLGALTGVYVTPFVSNIVHKYGNLVEGGINVAVGVLSFIGGMYIKNDELSAFIVGLGLTFVVEGLLRLVMPNMTPFNSVAVASTRFAKNQTATPQTKNWY